MDPRRDPARTHLAAESEAAYFDALVREEGEFDPFTTAGWDTIRRGFLRMIRPGTGLRILDIGCGTGQSRKLYIEHAASYVGIDLAEEALVRARAKFPADRWECADARALPFPDGSFDLVCFSSVLHHIPDFEAALREGRRVLAAGGQVFAFDPNLLNPVMATFRHPRSPLYTDNGVSPNEAPLLPVRLRRAFATAGFTAIQQRAQSDVAYREVAPRLLNAGLKVFNLVDHLFERSGLGRWFGTFVLTAGAR